MNQDKVSYTHSHIKSWISSKMSKDSYCALHHLDYSLFCRLIDLEEIKTIQNKNRNPSYQEDFIPVALEVPEI